jgi:hypothetical protein
MSKGKIDELMQKYEEGTSSLHEEQILFNNTSDEPARKVWSDYKRMSKVKAPKNLTDTVMQSIQSKETQQRKLRIGIVSVAASIMLLLSFSLYTKRVERFNYMEKEALLEEALSMLSEDAPEKIKMNVLYEDNSIIIYSTSK